jgi:hypothetical protein
MAMLDPNKAWSLFMMDPVDFLIALGAVIAFFGGGAWWLRGHWTSERIATLEERLRLAQDGQANVKKDVERLQTQVGKQEVRQFDNETSQTNQQLEPPKTRVIIDVSPAVLVGIYKNHISIEADKLIQSYIGKSIRVSGLIGDVFQNTKDNITVILKIGKDIDDRILIFCRFSAPWHDRAEILRREQSVKILGQIDLVENYTVRLIDCELVDQSVAMHPNC